MKIIRLTEHDFIEGVHQVIKTPLSATLGYFDGLHRGHQALFAQTLKLAREKNYASAVITFDFSLVKSMTKRENHLLTQEETQDKLKKLGFDYYVVVGFGDKLKNMLPLDFIKKMTTLFALDALTVGEDFRFGSNRSGDVEFLLKQASEFKYELSVVPLLLEDNSKIGSSTIEKLITEGHIEQANNLLGYPYEVTGEVIHGEQRGRTIGFPTANMVMPKNKIIPANGVYVACVIIDGKKYGGMTNIGLAPTLKNISKQVIETNIFDFDENIYGKEITVLFYKHIRDEQKFNGIAELKAQLGKDIIYSQDYLKKNV